MSLSPPGPLPLKPLPEYSADYGYPGAPGPAPGLVYARFWRRFTGYLIDTLLVGVPVGIASYPLIYGPFLDALRAALKADSTGRRAQAVSIAGVIPMPTLVLFSLAAALVGALYSGVLVSVWGRTLGQAAMRVRVVRQEDPYRRLPPGRALLRALPWWGGSLVGFVTGVSSAFGLITFLAFLWVAWDPQKQGLHDKIGRALVVGEAPQAFFAPSGAGLPGRPL